MNITFKLVSDNSKTGPIPVSTSSADTCPDACPLKAAKLCYAQFGPIAIHWNKLSAGLSKKTLEWNEFLRQVKHLYSGQFWRHNQAGDLAGTKDVIDTVKLAELTVANKGKRGWTYTHYPVVDNVSNAAAIKSANANGFTVNLSADSMTEADSLLALGIGPVVVIVPEKQVTNCKTPKGARVMICPASIRDKVTCSRCGLCYRAKRDYVIGFPAHGVRKKATDAFISA